MKCKSPIHFRPLDCHTWKGPMIKEKVNQRETADSLIYVNWCLLGTKEDAEKVSSLSLLAANTTCTSPGHHNLTPLARSLSSLSYTLCLVFKVGRYFKVLKALSPLIPYECVTFLVYCVSGVDRFNMKYLALPWVYWSVCVRGFPLIAWLDIHVHLKCVCIIFLSVFFSMVSSRGRDAQQTQVCAGEKAAVQWRWMVLGGWNRGRGWETSFCHTPWVHSHLITQLFNHSHGLASPDRDRRHNVSFFL